MPPTRVSSRSPGVTLTSQAERLFNFDIGFAADHFELFSLLFFLLIFISSSVTFVV